MGEGGGTAIASRVAGAGAPAPRRGRPAREAGPAEAGRWLFELLERVERMRGTQSITVAAADGRVVGEVLVSEGQVGLVALADGQMPLSARLRRRDPAAADSVQAALRRARAEGRPLGAVLHEIGGAEAAQIRGALLDQIAEGLATIAQEAAGGLEVWSTPLSTHSARSVLSAFPAAEVYWRTVARILPACADAATRCLRAIDGHGGPSLLVAVDAGGDVPIEASGGLEALPLADLAEARGALDAFARPPLLAVAGGEPRFSVRRAGAGDSIACVSSGAQVAILGGLDQHGLGRAIAAVRGQLEAEV